MPLFFPDLCKQAGADRRRRRSDPWQARRCFSCDDALCEAPCRREEHNLAYQHRIFMVGPLPELTLFSMKVSEGRGEPELSRRRTAPLNSCAKIANRFQLQINDVCLCEHVGSHVNSSAKYFPRFPLQLEFAKGIISELLGPFTCKSAHYAVFNILQTRLRQKVGQI